MPSSSTTSPTALPPISPLSQRLCAWVLANDSVPGQCVAVALTPELLDKVMTELVLVAASATSKREEAANLARIWGRRVDRDEQEHRSATA